MVLEVKLGIQDESQKAIIDSGANYTLISLTLLGKMIVV